MLLDGSSPTDQPEILIFIYYVDIQVLTVIFYKVYVKYVMLKPRHYCSFY